jgi:DNA-directed RNA polymerase specialized sigma subunit
MSKQTRAKDFMSQALHIDQRINNNIEQIHALRELAGKASATLSDVKVSGTRNISRMEDAIVRMVDLESDINEDVARLVSLKQDIVSVVKRVENPIYQTLLSLRYLCFKTWEQTAEAMNYSVQHVHRIHGGALEAVETILRHDRAG